MRPIFIVLLLAGAGIVTWLILSRPGQTMPVARQEAIKVSQHSQAFNNSIDTALSQYHRLSEQFVTWDSAGASTTAATLTTAIENIRLEDLKKDSSAIFETAIMFVENAKANAQEIAAQTNIRQQREAFHSLTDNFYQLLKTVNYDQQALYLQECPMAFDDTKAAQWLSSEEKIRNPYLGLYHPTYGKGMLSCGETKTSLNNTGNNK